MKNASFSCVFISHFRWENRKWKMTFLLSDRSHLLFSLDRVTLDHKCKKRCIKPERGARADQRRVGRAERSGRGGFQLTAEGVCAANELRPLSRFLFRSPFFSLQRRSFVISANQSRNPCIFAFRSLFQCTDFIFSDWPWANNEPILILCQWC